MISPKKLVKLARKWQRQASVVSGKCNSFQRVDIPSLVAEKGHFVIYTADQNRFVIPLMYLNHNIFRELFKMSEDEFGLPSDGPITLPCDAAFMMYVIKIIQRGVAEELETALLISVARNRCCSFSSLQDHDQGGEPVKYELLVCGY